jgi:hypothetical protein
LVSLLLWPTAVFAQSARDKVSIMSVRIGFLPGPQGQAAVGEDDVVSMERRDPLHKPGAWTPVHVTVINNGKYDPDPKKDGPAEVVVEVADCDDTAHNYSVPLPALKMGDSAEVIAYTRAGSGYTDFVIHVQSAAGRELCQPQKLSIPGVDPREVLYLAIGSRIPGLVLPGQQMNAPRQQNLPPGVMANTGERAVAGLLTRVPDLPATWLGYDAADVVILATSDRTFMNAFIGDPARTGALAEWVRRGGRLVVLAGPLGADVVKSNPDLNALLPMDIHGLPYKATQLLPLWSSGSGTAPQDLLTPGRNTEMELTKFVPREKPARAYHVLMEGPKVDGADGSPLVVQGPYGLGQVTLVALDLDKAPFSQWSGRGDFWKRLLHESGPRTVTNFNNPNYGGRVVRGMYVETDTDQQAQGLYTQLENFEGVPVISFGWVALFILLYILVVGPLDYLFLKKVVKRLELTWITFPTVVLAVSAAAYFTAYYLKGSELRINKFDLVDIDLQTQRVYGRAWFSIFSPRIQKYTVGLQPAEGWAGPNETTAPDATVSWFGIAKPGRQSLFRHSYDYAPLAEGLRGVPIQVWTTKGFQASWQAPLPKDPLLIASDVRHPIGKPDDLIGSVTSHLPAPLEDVVLIYRDKVARLDTLLPDQKKVVTSQAQVLFTSWLSGSDQPTAPPQADQNPGAPTAPTVITGKADQLKAGMLFAQAAAGQGDANNASLRAVDQSWRVNAGNTDEAILVGRLKMEQGPAEQVTAGPVSPSRLWLGTLPSSGQPRPPVSGKLRQDTIVRVFIPIAPEPRIEK